MLAAHNLTCQFLINKKHFETFSYSFPDYLKKNFWKFFFSSEQRLEVVRGVRGSDPSPRLALQRLQHLRPQERAPLHVRRLLRRTSGTLISFFMRDIGLSLLPSSHFILNRGGNNFSIATHFRITAPAIVPG